MAGYKKYDERIDELVVETVTFWDDECGDLTDSDMAWLSDAIHRAPQLASNIRYERAHTGFTREIKVTIGDIQRLYQERMA
jgi:hypothetical protein